MLRNGFKGTCLYLLLPCIFLCLAACGSKDASAGSGSALICEDALGDQVEFTARELERIADGTMKVAVLNGSFAEIWSLAGGKLAAVTEDAYEDGREMAIDDGTVNVGTLRNPNLEVLLASDIELAILSADLESNVSLHDKLKDVGIKTVYQSVETFEDYLETLDFFTKLTGREDRYEQYGALIEEEVRGQIARQDDSYPTALLLRAYGSGVKAKGSDNMTGAMLRELGCINIADGEGRLTDELSLEAIIEKDPEYIFVTVMGNDEEAGLKSIDDLLAGNPAWNDLAAVRKGHYYVLPKNMFHNKPNQRWGESYRMLADILYPEMEES